MMKKLDQSGDANFSELTRFARLYDFPEFVKSASLGDITTPTDSKPTLYADVRPPYQFPCHTKAATFVSCVYFLEKQAELDKLIRDRIKYRLDKFAEYWGISNLVDKLASTHDQLHFKETPASSFALVTEVDGKESRHYPLRNPDEVKTAADWFCNYLDEIRQIYTFPVRQKIASKILEKASEYKIDLGDKASVLEKTAGFGVFDPVRLSNEIRRRIKHAKQVQPEIKSAMEKLAEAVETRPSVFINPKTACFLASTLDSFDRTNNLLKKYSSILPAPEDAVFQSTVGQIKELKKQACAMTTGAIFDKADFEKLSLADIKDVFGDDLADEVSKGLKIDVEKLAEIAATFPVPDAEIFEDLVRSKGIQPIVKQASIEKVGFSFNAWLDLARVSD